MGSTECTSATTPKSAKRKILAPGSLLMAITCWAFSIPAVLNLVLTLILWVPGVVHAIFVVHGALADKRVDRVIETISKSGR
ncbi:YqaE/Pmp3 family membrane protein [Thermodesulfobacteriota bacterium]